MEQFNEDIFVIDTWIDNESKEQDLINLINRLKTYNAPILLTGHYPIKPEIQSMSDFYLYDRNNPLLIRSEFANFGINSVRWTNMGNFRVENNREFHHDYAIWETMRNAFNFCKYLGKKYIHFLEYDNLPDAVQYRQTFLERIRNFDVVITEYHKGSSSVSNENPYCATYIFSIKTDIAVRSIDLIKTKDEFFRNKPDKWQLEKNFLNSVRKITDNIHVCRYIPNNGELNMRALWNRDGINRNGVDIQFYLAINNIDDLCLHVISDGNYPIEITYGNYKEFHSTTKNGFYLFDIGKYEQGKSIIVYHQGIEIFNEVLSYDIDKFRELNKIIKSEPQKEVMEKPSTININFIDGPFVEILEKKDRIYHVQFINKKNNVIEYELDLKNNQWAKCSKKYYINWLIKIRGVDNNFHYEYSLDLNNKRVLMSFESKSIGDTLAWISYVEKFRIDHQCEIICSTFHNNLLLNQYPEIQFINPGEVKNVFALYRLGVFHNSKKEIDFTKHPTDPKREPLTKMASDILGLDYVEIRPKLPVLSTVKKKMVSIGYHATAQCKYWNNPKAWQNVVDFLNSKGYEVRLLSNEPDGYMGNANPKNVTRMPANSTLEMVLKTIQESELFIGISSGLSWMAWGSGVETILISGFTDVYTEPFDGIRRVINKDVCNSCWNKFDFDPANWNWCPVLGNTNRIFECTKTITSNMVIKEIKLALKLE
jgi:autotransporter strand-loop-strand O-heptosyltransferase